MRKATAGTTLVAENTRTRLAAEISSSAAVVAFVSPGQPGGTAANTYDPASVPPVAGDDPVNESDPSGDFTLGACVSDEAALGLGSFGPGVTNTGAVCLTRTVFDINGQDDIGLTETLGNLDGHTLGADISGALSFQVSNANTLQELSGVFTNTTFSAGALGAELGPGVSGSYFTGTAADGRKIWGVTGGISFGAGFLVAKFDTTTWVQQAHNWFLIHAADLLWDVLVPGPLNNVGTIGSLISQAITATSSSSQAAGSNCTGSS